MAQSKWELLVNSSCELGECPVWDEQTNSLWWVDIAQETVHRFDTTSSFHEKISVAGNPGCMAFTNDRMLVMGMNHRFVIFDPESKSIVKEIVVGESNPAIRFNDGKCDPQGRFWAGTMAKGEKEKGRVWCLDSDYTIKIKIDKVSVSNGMAWNREGNRFYYIDSPTMCVMSYDYFDGQIQSGRPVVYIREGLPDGMTIDEEGMLWIAIWGRGCVNRYDTFAGTKIGSFKLPVLNVTSCTFGGVDMDELYVTSAKAGPSGENLKYRQFAGGVFVIRNTGSRGMSACRFDIINNKRT